MFRLPEPAETYPDADLALYLDDKGRVGLGVFARIDPTLSPEVKQSMCRPHPSFIAPVEIEVRTHAVKTAAVLTIAIDGNEPVEITREQIASLPRAGDWKDKKPMQVRRLRGWHIRDVVSLAVDPDKVAPLTLVARSSDRVELSMDELGADGAHPVFRINRRGAVQFRFWKLGDDTGLHRELRDVVRIEARLR